jgi:hypothetical protein
MSTEYKGYLIASDGTYGMKEIKPVGKGSVPGALRGAFTSMYMAQKVIDLYMSSKTDKE